MTIPDPRLAQPQEMKADTHARVEPLSAGAAPQGSTAPRNQPSPALPSGRNERRDVFMEIHAERLTQDAQWGGSEHDDRHPPEDWLDFIRKQVDAADSLIGNGEEFESGDAIYRQRMVKVAALAVAAIETLDRWRSKGVCADELSAVLAAASPPKQPNPCPVCGTFLWDDPRPCWNCKRFAASPRPEGK